MARVVLWMFLGFASWVCGCAISESGANLAHVRAASCVESFGEAVLSRDHARVYGMLDASLRARWDALAFERYFEENVVLFEELALEMRSRVLSRELFLEGYFRGGPCIAGWIAPNEGDEWKLEGGILSLDFGEEAKRALILALRSEGFVSVLRQYSQDHPELPGSVQRALKRELLYGESGALDVEFTARWATVRVGGIARLQMVCTEQGWRLQKCSSLR